VSNLAGIGKSGRKRLSKVLERSSGVITSASVAEAIGVSPSEANRLLSRWCRNGWLSRVKRGAYIAVPLDSSTSDILLEEPFLIAESLYHPGYVGGFSAVKHWDLSEQIIETVHYFSTKQCKDLNPIHGGIRFKLKTIKAHKLFGTKNLWYGSQKIKISDPTKTMVDIFDDPSLVGGMTIVYDVLTEYVTSEYCDFSKLYEYAEKMDNKTIFKRLGFLLDTKFDVIPDAFTDLHHHLSAGYSGFDPAVESYRTVEKWKLKVPASWKDEYDRKKRDTKNR